MHDMQQSQSMFVVLQLSWCLAEGRGKTDQCHTSRASMTLKRLLPYLRSLPPAGIRVCTGLLHVEGPPVIHPAMSQH